MPRLPSLTLQDRVRSALTRPGRNCLSGAALRRRPKAILGQPCSSRGGLDPSTTEKPLPTVARGIDDASLSGRDPFLAIGEIDDRLAILETHACRLQRPARADTRQHFISGLNKGLERLIA